MDPIRNPYAPGAGQRPPELAGRDRELRQFEITLERVASGRPERSLVLSGLRGVGKTVLLNALRSLAVQRVADGGSALDPDVVQRMVGRRRHHSKLDDLTPRERQVLELMAQGRSNQGIADELIVTVAAVERHVTSIFSKLDLRQAPEDHRRVLAVLQFLKRS